MFEDKEPVDIFAEVDKPTPSAPPAGAAPLGAAPLQGGRRGGFPLLGLAITVVVLGALGGGGYWAYRSGYLPFLSIKSSGVGLQSANMPEASAPAAPLAAAPPPAEQAAAPSPAPVPPATTEQTPPVTEQPTQPPATTGPSANQPPLPPELAAQLPDTDHDGLVDADEVKLGTDPNSADTDGDGLADGDEAHVFATDPLKADSDGDSYSDGQEVKGGYNPTGSGKFTDEEKNSYMQGEKQFGLHQPTMQTIGRQQALP